MGHLPVSLASLASSASVKSHVYSVRVPNSAPPRAQIRHPPRAQIRHPAHRFGQKLVPNSAPPRAEIRHPAHRFGKNRVPNSAPRAQNRHPAHRFGKKRVPNSAPPRANIRQSRHAKSAKPARKFFKTGRSLPWTTKRRTAVWVSDKHQTSPAHPAKSCDPPPRACSRFRAIAAFTETSPKLRSTIGLFLCVHGRSCH